MALALSLIMFRSTNALIANVAELFRAVYTFNDITFGSLFIDLITTRTLSAKLKVDVIFTVIKMFRF